MPLTSTVPLALNRSLAFRFSLFLISHVSHCMPTHSIAEWTRLALANKVQASSLWHQLDGSSEWQPCTVSLADRGNHCVHLLAYVLCVGFGSLWTYACMMNACT